jgi:hypothetical protein
MDRKARLLEMVYLVKLQPNHKVKKMVKNTLMVFQEHLQPRKLAEVWVNR